MDLKSSSSPKPLLAAMLISGVFIVAAALTANYEEFREDMNEYLMSFDPGYYKNPGLAQLFLDLPDIIQGKLAGFPGRLPLETLYIDINPEEYRMLLADREQAITNNVLIDPAEIPGRIRYQGRQLRADFRLKGDQKDHWISKHRMSFRIKLENDDSLLGFNEFSIQKPASRQHPFDQAFQSVVRASGNLGAVHEYVNVVFNGLPWGVMILEEAMTPEFLEKQGRKDSLVLRLTNEDMSFIVLKARVSEYPIYLDYRLSDARLYVKMYEEGNSIENINFRKWYSHVAEQRVHGTEAAAGLYDVASYGRALFLSALWNDGHALYHANARHYFNPYTLQLEPITTDAYIPHSIRVYQSLFPRQAFNPLDNNDIYNQLLASGEFREKADALYDEALAAMLGAKAWYLHYLSYFPMDAQDPNFLPVMEDNILLLNVKSNRDTAFTPRPFNTDLDVRPPSPAEIATLSDHVHIRHKEDGSVDIYNLLPDTVHLDRLILDGLVDFTLDRDLAPYEPGLYQPLTVQTGFEGFLDGRLAIETVYADQKRTTTAELTMTVRDMHNPLLQETVTEGLPWLTFKDGQWNMLPGDWEIGNPLVLKGDLVIPAGTTLRFADDAYLIVHGSLQALGEEQAPVVMQALNDSWKGLYVLNAASESRLQQVRIRNYRALEEGLLVLTGGVTFYEADVIMDHVTLEGAQGEDALNVVQSHFELAYLTITDSASDAFDSDYSEGVIMAPYISGTGGDALDFSGSTVLITGIRASNIRDKAISIGEASTVTINGGLLANVGSGIVSKDGSTALATDVVIESYVLAGVMSYQKKNFYAPASLELHNIGVDGEAAAIRQTGTVMVLNGQPVREQDVDVDYLYENTVMQK